MNYLIFTNKIYIIFNKTYVCIIIFFIIKLEITYYGENVQYFILRIFYSKKQELPYNFL